MYEKLYEKRFSDVFWWVKLYDLYEKWVLFVINGLRTLFIQIIHKSYTNHTVEQLYD